MCRDVSVPVNAEELSRGRVGAECVRYVCLSVYILYSEIYIYIYIYILLTYRQGKTQLPDRHNTAAHRHIHRAD